MFPCGRINRLFTIYQKLPKLLLKTLNVEFAPSDKILNRNFRAKNVRTIRRTEHG